MDGTLAIVLLAVCLGLLLAEVFIPSGGLLLVTALVALAGSIWLAWRAWSEEPLLWWSYIGSVVVILPSSVGAILYWLPRTNWGKRILLEAPAPEEVVGYAEETEKLRQLIGRQGRTLTLMTPGGMVRVGEERYHAQSEGLLIEAGKPIEVVDISGNHLVVREVAAEESAASDSESSPERISPAQMDDGRNNREKEADIPPDATAGGKRLDFEVPQG